MKGQFSHLKNRAKQMRGKGRTYGEIQAALEARVPKSTLAHWCKSVPVPHEYFSYIELKIKDGGERGRAMALAKNRQRRSAFLKGLRLKNLFLKKVVYQNKKNAKLALAILYLAEGGKTRRGSLMFGNSDPGIIKLFLKLLKTVYPIDNNKFRCTILCRADQNTKNLEMFWSHLTKIPRTQFYGSRIDPRTIGRVSSKMDYRGVCRLDYFSSIVYNDLLAAGEVIINGK